MACTLSAREVTSMQQMRPCSRPNEKPDQGRRHDVRARRPHRVRVRCDAHRHVADRHWATTARATTSSGVLQNTFQRSRPAIDSDGSEGTRESEKAERLAPTVIGQKSSQGIFKRFLESVRRVPRAERAVRSSTTRSSCGRTISRTARRTRTPTSPQVLAGGRRRLLERRASTSMPGQRHAQQAAQHESSTPRNPGTGDGSYYDSFGDPFTSARRDRRDDRALAGLAGRRSCPTPGPGRNRWSFLVRRRRPSCAGQKAHPRGPTSSRVGLTSISFHG